MKERDTRTPEERAVDNFGSIENLKQQLTDKIQGLNADVLLILYEIIIRIG